MLTESCSMRSDTKMTRLMLYFFIYLICIITSGNLQSRISLTESTHFCICSFHCSNHFYISLYIRLCTVFACISSTTEKWSLLAPTWLCGTGKNHTVLNQECGGCSRTVWFLLDVQGFLCDVQGCFYWSKIVWLITHCGQVHCPDARSSTHSSTIQDASF